MKRFLYLALAVIFILSGIAFRKLMNPPYVWSFAFVFWAVAFIFLALHAKSNAARTLCLSAMAALLALSAMEGYLSLNSKVKPRRDRPSISEIRQDRQNLNLAAHLSHLEKNDPDLGARPGAVQIQTASRVLLDDELVFDVIYSTLDSGWRVTPQPDNAEIAVVFFGCSFTIGEGLQDKESYPYRVGELLGDRFQVFNFGFHGYGSHQMLAQIQSGFLEDISRRYKKIIPFYLTINGHELRCAGYSHWDQYGPWYAVENGEVTRKGKFIDNKRLTRPFGHKILRDCLIYKAVQSPKVHDLDALGDLHAAIIARADEELREYYDCRLTVLVWPDAPYAPKLDRLGVRSIDLAPLYPGIETKNKDRFLIRHDGHPTALAADVLARYLAAFIAKEDSSVVKQIWAAPEDGDPIDAY